MTSLYLESNIWHKRNDLQKANSWTWRIDLWLQEWGGSGMDWKFGVRCKLLHLERISNEILLYNTGTISSHLLTQRAQLSSLSLSLSFFFFFGHTHSMQKFLGWERTNLSHSSDNAESSTTRPPGNSPSSALIKTFQLMEPGPPSSLRVTSLPYNYLIVDFNLIFKISLQQHAG